MLTKTSKMREAGFYTGKATYRILFATQWGFIAVGLLALPFLPEYVHPTDSRACMLSFSNT